MSEAKIIFRSTVEIRRTAKLRFQNSAIQLNKDGGFENTATWPAKDLIWMPYEMSFSIGCERIFFKSYFKFIFRTWRCSQFGDQMKMSSSEIFSRHALQVVSNTGCWWLWATFSDMLTYLRCLRFPQIENRAQFIRSLLILCRLHTQYVNEWLVINVGVVIIVEGALFFGSWSSWGNVSHEWLGKSNIGQAVKQFFMLFASTFRLVCRSLGSFFVWKAVYFTTERRSTSLVSSFFLVLLSFCILLLYVSYFFNTK